jgi:hypothetical protein
VNSTQFLKPYPSQYDLRGESMTCYGSDFRGCVDYNFNNQGFRSDFDYDLTDPDHLLVCTGSSIGTGHGLDLKQSFGFIAANVLNKKLWNLGQGCFRSSNHTMLEQVKFLVNTDLKIDYYVIQFTHINRMGDKSNSYLELDPVKAVENFSEILKTISALLEEKKWCWLLTDYSRVTLPSWIINHPNKIIIDPDSVDFVPVDQYRNAAPTEHALKMLSVHPGPDWNKHIATLILEYFLRQQ